MNRRKMMQAAAAAAVAPGLRPAFAGTATAAPAGARWPIAEGPDTPKICLELWRSGISAGTPDESGIRRVKQIGVTHVLAGGPRMPWTEESLRRQMAPLRAGGLTVCNLMIGGFQNSVYGRPGRDKEIEQVIQSIHAAGKVGLPVIEYNLYAHRLSEGYYEQTGRGGSGHTAYDYERAKNLPPLPNIGVHSLEQLWKNAEYFLKAVVPEAEKAGVRLALHPNDPPVPLSRGSAQIMGTLAGWKRLIEIVDSPANGITYDCGVTKEMGEDPVEVCRYFASRKRINHVHFRNVVVRKPYMDYTEVAPDEGEVDMFGVMKELIRNKYTGVIYPEHPRALDADRERPEFKPLYPGGGGYTALAFNVAYARAMMQAALAS